MSDLIVIQPQVTQLTVTEDVNQVVVSSVGVQGPAGATGATGAKGDTGDQGPSGVVAVTAPITNSGTSTSANIGINLSNIAAKYANPFQINYRSGYWYESQNGALISNTGGTQNRLYAYPVFVQESITIDRLGLEVQTQAASSTIRVGIYNSDSNAEPSTLVLDAGTVSGTTTGLKAITISQTLSAGLYYFAWVWQGAVGRTVSNQSNSGNWAPVASTTQGPSAAKFIQYQIDGITGSLPSTFTTPFTISANNQTRIQYRVA